MMAVLRHDAYFVDNTIAAENTLCAMQRASKNESVQIYLKNTW